MINRNYYEKNNGYRYVIKQLKIKLGNDTTESIIKKSVSECNTLCKKYNNQPRRLKMHTHRMIFPRVSFYLEMIKYISRKDALALLNKAIEIGVEDDVKRLKSITRFRFFGHCLYTYFLWQKNLHSMKNQDLKQRHLLKQESSTVLIY